MHSLEADLALPHALEPALSLLLLSGALPSSAALVESLAETLRTKRLSSLRMERALAEERSRGAEHGGCGRHPVAIVKKYQVSFRSFVRCQNIPSCGERS